MKNGQSNTARLAISVGLKLKRSGFLGITITRLGSHVEFYVCVVTEVCQRGKRQHGYAKLPTI